MRKSNIKPYLARNDLGDEGGLLDPSNGRLVPNYTVPSVADLPPVSMVRPGVLIQCRNTGAIMASTDTGWIVVGYDRRNVGAGVRVALLGASIIARCTPALASGIYTVYTMANWAALANARLGGVLEYTVFGGVGGDPIAAIRARYETDVRPYLLPGDYVFLGGDGFGNSIANSVSVASMLADWQAIVAWIFEDGCTPIVATCPPNAQITSAAKQDLWCGINKAVMDACRADPRLIPVRWDIPHTDPTTTYANSPAANGWTIDDTHQQPKLAVEYDRLFAEAIAPHIIGGKVFLPWHTHNADAYRLVENPTMSGSAGGVATSWSLSGAGTTGSKVARTDKWGHNREWQRLLSAAATANAVLTSAAAFTLPVSGVLVPVPGVDYVRGYARIQVNAAPVNLRGVQLDLQFSGSTQRAIGLSTGATAAASGGNYTDIGPYLPTGIPLVIETPAIQIPAGATAIKPNITVTKSAAGNMDADIYVSDVLIRLATSSPPKSGPGVID